MRQSLLQRRWARYGLAVAAMGASALLRWFMPEVLSRAPYLGFYPAVVVAAALGGVGPGLVATFGSLAFVNLVFVQFNLGDYGLQMRNLIWIVGSTGVSLLAGRLRDARRQAEAEATAARTAEAALRDREASERRQREFLECIFANAGSCIAVVKGRELRYMLANSAFQAYAGNQPMVGRTYREVFPEAAAAGAEGLIQRVLETGEPWKVESYQAPVPGKPDAIWQGQVVRLPAVAGEEPSAVVVVWDVTERRRSEEALRKNEARMRAVFRALAEGIIFINRECVVQEVNEAAERMGFTRQFLTNPGSDPRFSILRSDGKPLPVEEQPAVVAVRTGQPVCDVEMGVPNANGDLKWILESAQPVQDESGEVVGAVASFFDITERKRAQEALRERDERFTTLIENLHSGVALADESGKFVIYNSAFLKLFGLASEVGNINDQDWSQWQVFNEDGTLLPVDDHPVRKAALTGQAVKDGLVRIKRPCDGSDVWLLVSAEPILKPNGQVRLLICTYYDVTELKKAEAALRTSESMLARAQQVANLGSWQWDIPTDTLVWSDQVYRIVGLNAGQFTPSYEAFLSVVSAEDRERVRMAVEGALAGRPYEVEFRITRPDSVQRYVLAQGEVDFDASGKPVRMIGTILDTTERKRAEEALRRSEERFRAVLENMSEGLMLFDAQQNLSYQNPASLRIHGFEAPEKGLLKREELPATWEAWNEAERLITFAEWPVSRVFRGERFQDQVLRVRRVESGQEFFGSYNGSPICGADGKLRLGFITIRDITEERKAQRALRESEERFRVAQELSPDGFLIFRPLRDATGVVTDFLWLYENAAAARMNDTHPEEVCGKRVSEVLPHHDESPFHKAYKEVAETGEVRVVEEAFYDQDTFRQRRWFRVVAVPTTGGDVAVLVQDVTERKTAEAALVEGQQRLRAVMQALPVGMAIIDAQGGATECNSAFDQIWRGPRPPTRSVADYAEYKAWWAHNGQQVQPEEWASARAVQKGETVVDQLIEIERFDGSRAVVLNSAAPIFGADGKVVGSAVAIQDVTALKETEKALRESERLYRAIGESIDYGIWICDAQGRNLYASESLLKLVGIKQEQCRDFGWGDVLHPDDAEATIAAWKECVRTGGPWYREHRYRGIDGQYHPILACGVAVRDEQGQIRHWAGINLDISRLKQAEESVRQSERRLKLAQQAAKIGAFEWNVETGVNVWTPELEAMYGLARGEFGKTQPAWEQLIHPEDRARAVRWVEQAFETGEPVEGEWRVVWRDGSIHWLIGRFQAFKDAAGKAPRLIGVNIDITGRKQAEGVIKSSLREKEVMLKEIHHRVKNNMQVISSLVDLQADALGDAVVREPFAEIRDRVRSMALVHEQLYQSESLAEVDFADYTQRLLNYLWHSYGNLPGKVELKLDLQPVSLPIDMAVPCGLLLNELATNALKHAFRNRPSGELSIALHPGPDQHVCFSVRDNGVGLPSGLDWRNARSMGLQLVRMLVKQLKADLRVTISGGTRFEIIFAQPQPRTERE